MLHSPETTPLSDFVNLDQRSQVHVLHELQKLSVAGDSAANVRMLFAEALQVVATLSPASTSGSDDNKQASTAARLVLSPSLACHGAPSPPSIMYII